MDYAALIQSERMIVCQLHSYGLCSTYTKWKNDCMSIAFLWTMQHLYKVKEWLYANCIPMDYAALIQSERMIVCQLHSYGLCSTYTKWKNDCMPIPFLWTMQHLYKVTALMKIDRQGSYRQVCVNSRTFQGLLKDFPTVFKDWKLMKNTDLHNKILLRKC